MKISTIILIALAAAGITSGVEAHSRHGTHDPARGAHHIAVAMADAYEAAKSRVR